MTTEVGQRNKYGKMAGRWLSNIEICEKIRKDLKRISSNTPVATFLIRY